MLFSFHDKSLLLMSTSLDWHPTDHVSFTDNAHLRKIAHESKVQDPTRFFLSKHVLFFLFISNLSQTSSNLGVRPMMLWSLMPMTISQRWNSPCGQGTVSRYSLADIRDYHLLSIRILGEQSYIRI